MSLLTVFFILNAVLLVLHEIESSYEKEWEILKIPVKITGFILLHVPILLLLFYGAIEIERQSAIGYVLGIISGAGGLIPFVVHKVVFKDKEHFNLPVSNVLIYSNIIIGALTAVLSIKAIS